MTWNDLVKKYFPNANDEDCEYILWNKTPFPISMDVELIKSYIKKHVEELKSSS